MDKSTRAFFQLFFWLFIWIVFGLSQGNFGRFFNDNWIVYLFQGLLLLALIYFLAPQLLFKKRYLEFAALSIGLLVLVSFFSAKFIGIQNQLPIHEPPFQMPHHPAPMRKGGLPSPFFINFLILTVTYVSAIFLETFVFAQKKEEDLILSKSETMETELKFLKSQINPHFLFNSLNNIYALSAIDPQKTQESILYLSDMLRYVLYDCEKSKVTIDKEVRYIEDFIKLFKVKSSKSYPIITRFLIADSKILVAPMLLIPFVENAFKHSNINDIQEAFFYIGIEAVDGMITFRIENSFSQKSMSKEAVGGIGIKNVQKRLALLYPDKHELKITEDQNLFKVELKINTNV